MGTLKRYKAYMAALHAFADAVGVKVVVCREDSEGAYSAARRTIRIDQDLSEAAEVATLLHELGHLLDDLSRSVAQLNADNGAYNAVIYSEGKKSPRRAARVLAMERRAWANGRRLAAHLHIKCGAWYDREEREALAAYRNRS